MFGAIQICQLFTCASHNNSFVRPDDVVTSDQCRDDVVTSDQFQRLRGKSLDSYLKRHVPSDIQNPKMIFNDLRTICCVDLFKHGCKSSLSWGNMSVARCMHVKQTFGYAKTDAVDHVTPKDRTDTCQQRTTPIL